MNIFGRQTDAHNLEAAPLAIDGGSNRRTKLQPLCSCETNVITMSGLTSRGNLLAFGESLRAPQC
jgi:hypothetical protein